MTDTILVTQEGGICRIVINRAERKNALQQAMYSVMIAALEAADQSSEVRAILLTAAGEVFCSGNDLADFARTTATYPAGTRSPAAQFPYVLNAVKKPLVAAVNGLAVGVGVTLLAQCDLVFATRSARLRAPFVDLALVPEGASSLLLPQRVGQPKANELLLLGETWTADEACAAGLVTRVFDDTSFADEVAQNMRRLAAKPPAALRESKQLMTLNREAIDARITLAHGVFEARLKSSEFAEASQAFMLKRKPDYSRFA